MYSFRQYYPPSIRYMHNLWWRHVTWQESTLFNNVMTSFDVTGVHVVCDYVDVIVHVTGVHSVITLTWHDVTGVLCSCEDLVSWRDVSTLWAMTSCDSVIPLWSQTDIKELHTYNVLYPHFPASHTSYTTHKSQLATNGTHPGLFQIRFQYVLAHQAPFDPLRAQICYPCLDRWQLRSLSLRETTQV